MGHTPGRFQQTCFAAIGVQTVILGHSERRAYFHETDELLEKKVRKALEKDMRVIFCFGEELADRKAGKHFEVVQRQLRKALFGLPESAWEHIVLAYEPVWAIGTGETASPEQAQEMHAFIRMGVAEASSEKTADSVSILYGGSVKPGNAREMFSQAGCRRGSYWWGGAQG